MCIRDRFSGGSRRAGLGPKYFVGPHYTHIIVQQTIRHATIIPKFTNNCRSWKIVQLLLPMCGKKQADQDLGQYIADTDLINQHTSSELSANGRMTRYITLTISMMPCYISNASLFGNLGNQSLSPAIVQIVSLMVQLMLLLLQKLLLRILLNLMLATDLLVPIDKEMNIRAWEKITTAL